MPDYLRTLERASPCLSRCRRAAGGAALRVLARRSASLAHAARWAGRAAGWDAPADCSTSRARTVSSVATCYSRSSSSSAPGDLESAAATAGEAAAIGERFGDADLFALAAHDQGHALIAMGASGRACALLDEAMVAVTAGELSPIVSGIVYCGVILACQDAHEVRRAREWTAALTRWCERQPDLVAFTGRCLVAPRRAHAAAAAPGPRRSRRRGGPASAAWQGENAAAAGDAPTARARSIACGRVRRGRRGLPRGEPARPGAAAGPRPAAARAGQGRRRGVRRSAGSLTETDRARPARATASGLCRDHAGGRRPRGGARRVSRARAIAAATTAARSAHGRPRARARSTSRREIRGGALAAPPRRASCGSELEAPYEAARVRELVGLACRALGDEDSAPSSSKRRAPPTSELGATPDLARSTRRHRAGPRPHGLTARELEVLRLVASGETNRAIAGDLVAQRAHGRPSRQQHLRQARRLLARRRHRVRLRARAPLSVGEFTHAGEAGLGGSADARCSREPHAGSHDRDYDAIVVGARCAGSPTAMLLARKGHRVLLLDKATFPSDTMSTHLVHPPGSPRSQRWGLLDAARSDRMPAASRPTRSTSGR